jgi:ABC-2 type transport system permease protein
LPRFLRPVAAVLPTTHSFEGMREAIERGGFSHSHFNWGFGLNMIYLFFAIGFFRLMFEAARARGLLVKME